MHAMPELLQLFLSFFQIGLFSIGGGYAMVPLIQRELVSHGWLTVQDVTDVVAISQMTPGPFAINAATFVGMRMGGVPGAVLGTLGVTLPSIIICVVIARFFFGFQKHPTVQGALYGIRPVTAALIASAAWSMATAVLWPNGVAWAALVSGIDWRGVVIFVIMLVGITKTKWHPIVWICISAALGLVAYTVFPVV